MRRAWTVVRRAAVAFYDDQMTQHASAMTYYGLMSLFPAALLALSLLGLLGQYPRTYDAIVAWLETVAPAEVLRSVDASLEQAIRQKGTAATAFVISVLVALYGTTGVLESARRALNVVFEIDQGRPFVRRKLVDIGSTVVLMALVTATLTLMFVGGDVAHDLADLVGLGADTASVWNAARWPAAFAVAALVFAWVYYVTPDVQHRAFRWITPGAAVGVALWLGVSLAFSTYITSVANVSAVYGTFAGAIVLIGWLWLTNVALLFGAELNAEIEREKELAEGVPHEETLNRPARR